MKRFLLISTVLVLTYLAGSIGLLEPAQKWAKGWVSVNWQYIAGKSEPAPHPLQKPTRYVSNN